MALPTLPPDSQLLSDVLRTASVGAWAVNVTQGVVEWATDVDAYSGFNESATSIEEILARVHPDDRESLIGSIAAPLEDGERYEHRYRIVNPDESIGHILSRGTAAIRPNGDLVITGVSQDITALVETGQALARSEARAHFLIEASSDLVGRHDAQGRFTTVSSQADSVIGRAQSELIGQPLDAWIHGDDVAGARTILADAPFKAGTTVTTVVRCLPCEPDEGDRWLETRWRRQPSLEGSWVSTTRDVTEQKRAAALAQRNQERLRRLTLITAQAEAGADRQIAHTLDLLVGAFDARAAVLAVEIDELLYVEVAAGPHAPNSGRVLAQTSDWPRPALPSKVWYTPDTKAQRHPAAEFATPTAIDLGLRVEGEYRGCVSLWLGGPVELTEADQHFLYLVALWLSGLLERGDVQKRLSASSDLLHGLLSSSLDGIMVFESVRDGDGIIVDFEWLVANQQNEILIDLSPADLVGKRLLEVLPGNREAGLFDAYVRVTDTGEPYQTVLHYAHDGIDFWVQIAAVQLGDGFFVTFRDVSEEQRTAERVRESEERYRLIAENSSDFVALHDASGRYRYVSPSARVVVGYEPSQTGGSRPVRLRPPRRLGGDPRAAAQRVERRGRRHDPLPLPPPRRPLRHARNRSQSARSPRRRR